MPFDQPPRGSGNRRLAAAVLAMSPALVATYAQAALVRSRFASVTAKLREVSVAAHTSSSVQVRVAAVLP